jgi:hypothetical protein
MSNETWLRQRAEQLRLEEQARQQFVNSGGLAEAMTGGTISRGPEWSSPLRRQERLITEPAKVSTEAKPQSEIDQARLEGVRERYQTGNDTAGSGNSTEGWDAIMSHAYGEPLGAKTERGVELGKNPEGATVQGKATLRADPTADALIQLGKTAKFDTSPHELIHVLLEDMKTRGGREKARAEAFEKAAGGEEAGVQASGEHFVARVMSDDSLWKDLGALVKHWMGSATKEDYARLMSNTLERGNIGEANNMAGKGGGVRLQTASTEPGKLGMDVAGSPEKTKFNIFSSVTDKLINSGDPGKAYLGQKFNELFRAKDEMAARYRTGINALYDAKPEQIDAVYKLLLGEERSGQPRRAVVRPDLLPLYDAMRGTYAKMREDQIAAGGKNRDGSKLGQDPTGFFNIIDPRVSEKISGGTRDAVYAKLKKDFIDYNRSRGVKNPEGEFDKYVGTLGQKSDPFSFKATDTRENTKLPDSWIEPDGLKAYNKYIDRWAKARTWEEGMLKDPRAAEALGLNKGLKGPDSTVVLDPNVQAAMDFYGGMNTSADHKFISSVGRLVNSLLLGGPTTRITDALTTPIKGLSYISPTAVPAYLHAMTNIRGAYERTLATGLNKRGGRQVFDQIIGAGADATGKLDAASQFITKWTGSEATETAARTLAQVAGEFIAKHQAALAAAGDRSAVKFLDHLGIVPGMDPAIAGTRAAQLLQGKYDVTNLPAWAFNSPAAPFVGMMKWNIEQWNNFKRFAVEPAVKDKNLTPALMTIAAGLTGGVGLNVFRQALSGRKDYHATFDEIANAPDKGRAMEELASKLAYAAQLTGTLGVMGELGSQMIEVGTVKIPNGVHYPAASVLAEITAAGWASSAPSSSPAMRSSGDWRAESITTGKR